MLKRVSGAETIVPNEKQGGTWDVFFWVEGVDDLFLQLKSNGADIAYDPTIQQSYQMKEFAVRDCNGYVLGFGQSLD